MKMTPTGELPRGKSEIGPIVGEGTIIGVHLQEILHTLPRTHVPRGMRETKWIYLMIVTPAARQGVHDERLGVMIDIEEREGDVSKRCKELNSLSLPSKEPTTPTSS